MAKTVKKDNLNQEMKEINLSMKTKNQKRHNIYLKIFVAFSFIPFGGCGSTGSEAVIDIGQEYQYQYQFEKELYNREKTLIELRNKSERQRQKQINQLQLYFTQQQLNSNQLRKLRRDLYQSPSNGGWSGWSQSGACGYGIEVDLTDVIVQIDRIRHYPRRTYVLIMRRIFEDFHADLYGEDLVLVKEKGNKTQEENLQQQNIDQEVDHQLMQIERIQLSHSLLAPITQYPQNYIGQQVGYQFMKLWIRWSNEIEIILYRSPLLSIDMLKWMTEQVRNEDQEIMRLMNEKQKEIEKEEKREIKIKERLKLKEIQKEKEREIIRNKEQEKEKEGLITKSDDNQNSEKNKIQEKEILQTTDQFQYLKKERKVKAKEKGKVITKEKKKKIKSSERKDIDSDNLSKPITNKSKQDEEEDDDDEEEEDDEEDEEDESNTTESSTEQDIEQVLINNEEEDDKEEEEEDNDEDKMEVEMEEGQIEGESKEDDLVKSDYGFG
ncbi:MAG: hypothetical protein EZS28_001792 [Streblomastix strix]|uniref:Uncharacterized protein n=1 Tax=Streblomastix strix TaxID=222440 RepID=A0A5J4X7T0_9EUKA|nr:MAG: hypothetical protein EZS28_001792 [Streblomastix strix]